MISETYRAKNINMELMLQEPKLALLTNCITSQAATLTAKVKNEQKNKQNKIKSVREKARFNNQLILPDFHSVVPRESVGC